MLSSKYLFIIEEENMEGFKHFSEFEGAIEIVGDSY